MDYMDNFVPKFTPHLILGLNVKCVKQVHSVQSLEASSHQRLSDVPGKITTLATCRL